MSGSVTISSNGVPARFRSMPELPAAMKDRLVVQHGITAYDAALLTSDRDLVDYYGHVVKAWQAGDAPSNKLVANWVLGEFSAALNKSEIGIAQAPVSPSQLAGLLSRISDGTISGKIAKDIFDQLWQQGSRGNVAVQLVGQRAATSAGAIDVVSVDAIIEARGLRQISDEGAIAKIVDAIIAANPGIVADVRAGKDKAFNALVGKVMAASKSKANPAQVNAILKSRLA